MGVSVIVYEDYNYTFQDIRMSLEKEWYVIIYYDSLHINQDYENPSLINALKCIMYYILDIIYII